jgi:hypothetical protein
MLDRNTQITPKQSTHEIQQLRAHWSVESVPGAKHFDFLLRDWAIPAQTKQWIPRGRAH